MKRVTGIGGIFFQAQDPAALGAWYQRHLGIDVQPWGGAAFDWTDAAGNPTAGTTAWSVFPADSDQFAPSRAPFMINYRVDDLGELLASLKAAGIDVLKGPESDDNGSFAWILDPDGNKVELWEPVAGA
jgi:predicted enzyme related to lactoylglutathione lyase